MYKLILTLYITCFGLYILFSRVPDYFDGEFTNAQIHYLPDSLHHQPQPLALFNIAKDHYQVNTAYAFRHFEEGERVQVIYETAQPAKAAVYSWWGYWIRWGEWLGSLVLLIAGWRIAVAVTANPDPTVEDEADKPRRKMRKYAP